MFTISHPDVPVTCVIICQHIQVQIQLEIHVHTGTFINTSYININIHQCLLTFKITYMYIYIHFGLHSGTSWVLLFMPHYVPHFVQTTRSPICSLNFITKLRSFGTTVILPQYIVQRLPSSNKFMRKTSLASLRAKMASAVNLKFGFMSCAIFCTTLWNSNFVMGNSTDF